MDHIQIYVETLTTAIHKARYNAPQDLDRLALGALQMVLTEERRRVYASQPPPQFAIRVRGQVIEQFCRTLDDAVALATIKAGKRGWATIWQDTCNGFERVAGVGVVPKSYKF